MVGPLDGIRIVDLTQVVAGPVCTMVLADQGAEVIKVEFPAGDILRHNRHYSKGEMNALTLNCNRGKRSIVVDLTTAEGVKIVEELAANADVFVQNFRAGVIERLGISHERLRELNPQLTTVWMSGFGQNGPMADIPVFDPVMQAVTGHCAVQLNPQIPFVDVHRTIVIDKSTALTTAQAITAALFARERDPERLGQHLEVSMLDVGLAFFWPDGGMAHTVLDEDATAGTTLYQAMKITECSDAKITYYVVGEAHFNGLFRAIGRSDWAGDPRYCTTDGRSADPAIGVEIAEVAAAAFLAMTRDEALARLRENDVPAGPVLALDELHELPQTIHNEVFHEWDHPIAGRLRQPRSAPIFDRTPVESKWSVPALGQHTDDVLSELGHDAEAIAALRASGVVS